MYSMFILYIISLLYNTLREKIFLSEELLNIGVYTQVCSAVERHKEIKSPKRQKRQKRLKFLNIIRENL